MKPTFFKSFFSSMVGSGAVIGLSAAALAGCSAGESAPVDTPEPPAGHEVVAEFILKVRPKEHRVIVERVGTAVRAPSAANGGEPGLSPESENDVNLQSDGIQGSGPANSVELVTNSASIVDTYGTGASGGCAAGSFCAAVTLQSFWTRPLSNTYVEITAVTDDSGAALTGHNATNSDGARFGLNATYGLWEYTSATGASTPTGVIGTGAEGLSSARTWQFANPDDANTNYRMRVVASTTYTNYTFATSFRSFINACTLSGHTQLAATSGVFNTTTVTMPFQFTLFGTTSSTAKFNARGQLTVGTGTLNSTGTNPASMPSTSAPRPAVFAFWDNIDENGTGMCYGTTGTAPNRKFVVTWTNMNFATSASSGDKPAHMTFSAVLNEGSDQVDLNYNSMTYTGTKGSTRYKGSSAVVGIQNAAGTVFQGTDGVAQYTSNTAKSFLPIP